MYSAEQISKPISANKGKGKDVVCPSTLHTICIKKIINEQKQSAKVESNRQVTK
jgi:hypothetical protein